MFRKLLVLDILSRMRSPFWQKSIGINIVLILLALYLMLSFLGLGFVLDAIIASIYPDADPLQVFNRFFLYYLVYDLIMRFFMQNLPVTALQSYLLLPIRRSYLVHYLLIKSIPNFFNILPFLLVIPFFLKVVLPTLGSIAWTWLATIVLLILLNHLLSVLLKRSFMLRPLAGLLLVIVIAALAYFDFQGYLPFSEFFGKWLAWTSGSGLYLLIPLALVISMYTLAYRIFYRNIYLDKLSQSEKQEAGDSRQLDWLNRFGKTGRLLQLDLQLVRRNKRPRIMATMSIFFLLYPLIVLQDGLEGKMGLAVFVAVFTTGLFMINYGQFMLAWESSFFDFLRVRQITIREYFESKFLLFGMSTLIALLLSMLYGFVYPILPLFFVAGAIFNMGVSTFILMFTCTYNVRKIDLGKGAFMNWEGVGAAQFLLILPIMVLPMLLYGLFNHLGGLYAGLGGLTLIGLIGLALRGPILNALSRQFEQRKYIMTSSFKKD